MPHRVRDGLESSPLGGVLHERLRKDGEVYSRLEIRRAAAMHVHVDAGPRQLGLVYFVPEG